jgi:hypothetical protein
MEVNFMLTLFVPLNTVQIELSTSTLSPNEYGNGGPFEIAETTADFKKSMSLSVTGLRATRRDPVRMCA